MMKVAQVALVLMIPFVSITVRGQDGETSRVVVVDKTVATVNGELITYSDLVWQLALQPGTALDNPSTEVLQSALRLVMEQRLIMQEAEKLPTISPSDKEIESALAELIRQFTSGTEFEERARKVGLSAEQIREIVLRRVQVEKYLDFRFRSFIVLTAKEIADYYRDVYVPRLRRRTPGRIIPTLEEARSEIEKTLNESKVESDITNFLDAARDHAEIVMLGPL